MGSKPSNATKLLPALGAGTNIGTKHLIPTLSRVFHRGTGRLGEGSVFKSANEILRDGFLRPE